MTPMFGHSSRFITTFTFLVTCCLWTAIGSSAQVESFAAPPLAKPVAEAAWHADLASARTEARREGRLILVDLYADWCGWCKAMERKVFETSKFRQHAQDQLVLLRVDTEDRAEGTELRRHYGANTLPTTLLLTEELTVVARIEGFMPLDPFFESLESAEAHYDELIVMFERFRDSPEPEVLSTLAQEMLDRRDGPRATHLYRRLLDLGPISGSSQKNLQRRHAAAMRLSAWVRHPDRTAQLTPGSREGYADDSP